MTSDNKGGFLSNLRYDLPASIVVFLVALPLCLGIALASGAPLFSGIIAGIVGGTIVALLSGSPLGVSGPAAGLAVIVLTSIQELGAFDIFLVAVVIAGFLQIALGLLRAGVIGYYFPSSVIKGMLSGIGIIIILKQIPHAFGYDKDPEGDFGFFQVDGETTFSEIANMINHVSPGVVIITFVSLGILLFWETGFMKRQSFTRIIPGPLVAVSAGIALNQIFTGDPTLGLKAEQMVAIPVAGISEFFTQFTTPDFSQIGNSHVWVVGATIAVVASLETLLCVEATDKLDPQKRVTPTNRELLAQGTGNIVSGLIGGLPITQVIVRSSANIQSGGQSKMSAFFHGLLLLLSAMTIPAILNLIPLGSLAAILLVVGFKLAKPALFASMYRQGISQFLPFIVTIVGIVFTDLLIGIALGLAVAVIQILWNNYVTPYHFDPETYKAGDPITITLAEDVSFLNKAGIMKTLHDLPSDAHIVIDASSTKTIHPDIIELIEDFRTHASRATTTVEVVGLDHSDAENGVQQFGRVVLNKKESRGVRIMNDLLPNSLKIF